MQKRRFRDDDNRDSISWKDIKRKPGQDGTSALVWGIGSFLIPFPVGLVAIHLAKQVLKRNPDDGMAKAGRVLGIVSLVFFWIPAGLLVVAGAITVALGALFVVPR
jgi:hypothetical protein